ncbi:aspartate 1-decarboxylase [Planctomycetales bacterium]|nr:aspartate 1-decarboxylase [Planctomycetales bacterium]
MFREMLKSKIHRATITRADLHYEGSVAVCPLLLAASAMRVGEKVLIANVNTGARFETYTIEGKVGEICLNGAAARLGAVGDKIIIMTFGWYGEDELQNYQLRKVLVDDQNRIKSN